MLLQQHYSAAGHLYVLNHQSSTCRKRKYPRATCPMTPNRGGFSPMNCRAAGQVDLCVCVCAELEELESKVRSL
jgi:hypothetical protein